MILAISLLAVVGLAIYGIFDTGIKVMRKIIRPVPGEDLNIFFEKFSHDLQNAFHYGSIPFRGETGEVIFPTHGGRSSGGFAKGKFVAS